MQNRCYDEKTGLWWFSNNDGTGWHPEGKHANKSSKPRTQARKRAASRAAGLARRQMIMADLNRKAEEAEALQNFIEIQRLKEKAVGVRFFGKV